MRNQQAFSEHSTKYRTWKSNFSIGKVSLPVFVCNEEQNCLGGGENL